MGGYQERAFKSDRDAADSIRRAVRDANGSMAVAASILGVSFRTLSRYVTKLGLREELKALGKADQPSQPGGASRAAGAMASSVSPSAVKPPQPAKDFSALARAMVAMGSPKSRRR
jgi:hypothetical protein